MMYILAQAVSHQNIKSKGVYIPLLAVYKFFRIGGAEGVHVSAPYVLTCARCQAIQKTFALHYSYVYTIYADIERSMGVSPLGIRLSGLRLMVASINIDGIYVFL